MQHRRHRHPRLPGAAEERAYEVDRDCAAATGAVVYTAYDSASDRDAAARRFEVQSRPSANGAIWTLGPFTVRVSGERDADALDALTNALPTPGADDTGRTGRLAGLGV